MLVACCRLPPFSARSRTGHSSGRRPELDAAAVSAGLRAGTGNGLLMPTGDAAGVAAQPDACRCPDRAAADREVGAGGSGRRPAAGSRQLRRRSAGGRPAGPGRRVRPGDGDLAPAGATRHRPRSPARRRRPARVRRRRWARPLPSWRSTGHVCSPCWVAPTEALDVGIPVLDELSGDDHAGLCLELARAAIVAGRWDQAQRLVERAGRPGDPRSLVLEAEASFGSGDVGRATATAQRRRRGGRARRCSRPAVRRPGHRGTMRQPHLERARRCGLRARGTVRRRARPRPWRVEALFGLGLAELSEGRPTHSLTQATRAGPRRRAADPGRCPST